jgi:excisionase family DNA binding protein
MAKKSPTPQREADTLPQVVTVKKAAELLSVHQNTIRKLIAVGDLQEIRAGRIVRVPVSSIEAWIASNS